MRLHKGFSISTPIAVIGRGVVYQRMLAYPRPLQGFPRWKPSATPGCIALRCLTGARRFDGPIRIVPLKTGLVNHTFVALWGGQRSNG